MVHRRRRHHTITIALHRLSGIILHTMGIPHHLLHPMQRMNSGLTHPIDIYTDSVLDTIRSVTH